MKIKGGHVPTELMNCGRIFGSIYISGFDFKAENTVSVIPLITRFGFGIHELKIRSGTISLNLLYLILMNIQETVEILELSQFKLKNVSKLQIFTGISEFQRLKKLVVRLDSNDEFFATIFQNAPVLENLKLYHSLSIIPGKTSLKKLSIGGDNAEAGKDYKFLQKLTLITYFCSKTFHPFHMHPSNWIN